MIKTWLILVVIVWLIAIIGVFIYFQITRRPMSVWDKIDRNFALIGTNILTLAAILVLRIIYIICPKLP